MNDRLGPCRTTIFKKEEAKCQAWVVTFGWARQAIIDWCRVDQIHRYDSLHRMKGTEISLERAIHSWSSSVLWGVTCRLSPMKINARYRLFSIHLSDMHNRVLFAYSPEWWTPFRLRAISLIKVPSLFDVDLTRAKTFHSTFSHLPTIIRDCLAL